MFVYTYIGAINNVTIHTYKRLKAIYKRLKVLNIFSHKYPNTFVFRIKKHSIGWYI